jgi:hypothetical protein
MLPYICSKWATLLPLIEQFGEKEDCDPADLAWY